jgi:protein phosphatase
MTLSWAARSDPGLRRGANEDNYAARSDLGLFVVADGMGGHAAGEVASGLAVDTIAAFIDQTKDATDTDTWPFPYDPSLSLAGNRLTAGFRLANRRIASSIADEQSRKGMATTAAAILVGTGAVVAHVGDSRVYLYRGGQLERLTSDHSWVEEQVKAGVLTASAARQHPWRNVVTRALSGGTDPEVDLADLTLGPGDRVLLCSDGLYAVVPDEEIAGALARPGPLETVCDELVRAANAAGGPDNITVLVLEVDAP